MKKGDRVKSDILEIEGTVTSVKPCEYAYCQLGDCVMVDLDDSGIVAGYHEYYLRVLEEAK